LAPQFRRLALPVAPQLLEAIRNFDCLGAEHADDPVAQNVTSFLADERFLSGLQHDVSATYLLIDQDAEPQVLGYATVTLDSVRLTNSEKRRMEDVGFSDFGALRIQMIGIDHRCQRQGHGTKLLEGVTGLARTLSETISVRFLLADANVRKVDWYEAAGFVRNQAEREVERVNSERSVSMRLDLLEGLLGGGGEDQEEAAAVAT
jgi:ribosomal protein S18 acetylase RimI-like enzyme